MVNITLKMIIAGIATYYICTLITLSHIAAIAVKLVICIVLPNIIFILLNIRNKDFKLSIQFLTKVIKGIRRENGGDA